MTQRSAALSAVALTAFIVIATVAVVLAMPGSKTADGAALKATTVTVPALSTADAQTLTVIQAREQAYQQQIEQANTQLKDAYGQLQQLQAQNQQLLQREQVYQQRLQESNQIIQSHQTQSNQGLLAFRGREHDDDW